MFLRVLFVLIFVLAPASAFAWGPLTHLYLGNEIYYLGSLLPVGVYSLIKRFRQDFLYGNLMADIIFAKKFLPEKKHSHNWDVALGLCENAGTQSETAFSMGYMSHLAADTVAHGTLTSGMKDLGHTVLELKADRMVDGRYWLQALSIDKAVQNRNDLFLERSLDRVFFSYKTNKRIFKSIVLLSGLNNMRPRYFAPLEASTKVISGLHEESLDRIVDVLNNGSSSPVLCKSPISSR